MQFQSEKVETPTLESSTAIYEPEQTPEGLVRRKASSPARHQTSRWLHIRGLKRPYTQKALMEMLSKFGKLTGRVFYFKQLTVKQFRRFLDRFDQKQLHYRCRECIIKLFV
jgi:hypothetical protein